MVRSSAQLYNASFDTTWLSNLTRNTKQIDIKSKENESRKGTFIFTDDNGAMYYFEYILWPEKDHFILKGGENRNKAAKRFTTDYLGNDEKDSYLIKLHKNVTRQIIDRILDEHKKNKVINPKFKFKNNLIFKEKEYAKLSYELGEKKSCALTDDKRDFEKLFKACNAYDFKTNLEIVLCKPLVDEYKEEDGELPYTNTLNISSYHALSINKQISIYKWLEFFRKFL